MRYMVDDADESIVFYTKQLGSELLTGVSPVSADVKRGTLRRLLLTRTRVWIARNATGPGVKPGVGGRPGAFC